MLGRTWRISNAQCKPRYASATARMSIRNKNTPPMHALTTVVAYKGNMRTTPSGHHELMASHSPVQATQLFMMKKSLQMTYDERSFVVPIDNDTLQGFSQPFTLRKSKDEAAANDGAHLARKDWRRFIGPIDTFGGCNPYQGNFTSLALPYTQPDRIGICAYFVECMYTWFAVLLVLILGDRCLLIR